ncbi:CCA tRNA nucleotidyltransferase, mitochondrial [Recurvomyces mirabilis]|nr:CCA tRNA nucleotidyltransferase, mitochondrial [Recurvomyces mirabilis]
MAPALIQEVDDGPHRNGKLDLTPVESTLRQLLLDVAKYVDTHPTPPQSGSTVQLPDELARQPIVLRFTGGWVRDKLLGVPSHDIDVAINKTTGYQFGLRLKEYLELPGNPEKYGLEGVATSDKQSQKAGTTDKSKTVGGLHKIEANPEKSKHLETVTTRILGLDIDLVNLRRETYSDDSRNPQMEFGTAEEDALRRDATVNAMFYNINTEEIEDFTGRGHDDMEAKILRTPLEPYQTFKDDPLRILRLIRFASRLGYTIDKKAMQAMKDAGIKDALRCKISRERVGVEMEKALRGPDPHEALRLVFDLGLYDTIFSTPEVVEADHYAPDTDGWKVMIDTLEEVTKSEQPLAEVLVRDVEERYMAWQLSALVPYRDAPQPESTVPGRKAPPMVIERVAREGIKATNKVTDVLVASVRNQEEISTLVDRLQDRKRRPDKAFTGEDASARDILGMAIRRWGTSWRSQVIYSFLVEVVENQGSVEATARKYTAFVQHLQNLNLLDVCTLKPLLDGKALAKALDTPPGPWMKEALDVVMAWQLRNPSITDPTQAIEQVRSKRGELAHALVVHFLKFTIRPLFAKTKPSGVTDQGRKIKSEILPKRIGMEDDEDAARPWKTGKDADVLHLLRWVVEALDAKLVEEVWPMIVPPVLTLLDDWEAKYKKLGAELLRRLLQTVPPLLLERTGLGEVFDGALRPCLTSVPPMTPEEDSIELLSAVYPALMQLAAVRYPVEAVPGMLAITAHSAAQRTKYLDSLLRKGIIQGCNLADRFPHVLTVLLQHLIPLLNKLGIESVKHLKYLLEITTPVLSQASVVAEIPTLLAATKALQAIILSCWPRIAEYRGEVLKGLALCWINIAKLDRPGAESLRVELKETVKILRAALRDEVDFRAEGAVLVAADSRLADLFR